MTRNITKWQVLTNKIACSDRVTIFVAKEDYVFCISHMLMFCAKEGDVSCMKSWPTVAKFPEGPVLMYES